MAMKITFIGGGIMGEALMAGLLRAKLAAPADIAVSEPVEARRKRLADTLRIRAEATADAIVSGADLVVLAIKPQNLADVMPGLGKLLTKGQTVASIIAGARIDTLSKGLGTNAVIRIMPNTPAQIGAGMTVWTATPTVPAAALDAAKKMLGTLGVELRVDDEKLIDMSTALSASGPAYVFLFIEALIDAGVYMGMTRDMARTLALQTVLGSAQMVKETGQHPAQLRDMVTSPGGTTAEALRAFENAGFRRAVIDAVVAAYEKSKRLGNS
ncbi:MAG: pyrroline-5-carboxylate reductase [SAR202 cluster bacterium]|nr:pyrroline-5-carboxylate reductase [SAR202 cluster bacterium]